MENLTLQTQMTYIFQETQVAGFYVAPFFFRNRG